MSLLYEREAVWQYTKFDPVFGGGTPIELSSVYTSLYQYVSYPGHM